MAIEQPVGSRAGAHWIAPMKRLPIDFAPRSLRQTCVQILPLTWLIASIGLGLCAIAAISAWQLLMQHQTLDAELQRAQQISNRTIAPRAVKKISISEAQASAVNRASAQLNLPWRDLLDAIEAATPASIALLVLEPDANKQVLKAIAEAKNSDDMLAYLEQLQRQPWFASVLLERHEINQQDPNHPLRFQFAAQWREPAL